MYEAGIDLIAHAASQTLQTDILAVKTLMVRTLSPEKIAELSDLCEELQTKSKAPEAASADNTDEDVMFRDFDIEVDARPFAMLASEKAETQLQHTQSYRERVKVLKSESTHPELDEDDTVQSGHTKT